jgi:hypothetical protein
MTLQLDQFVTASTGHSSTVDMILHIGSNRYSVVQSSERDIKLNDPNLVPQGDAVLETIVDGRSHQRRVRVVGAGHWPNWLAIVDR